MSEGPPPRNKRNAARTFKNPPQPHMCIRDSLQFQGMTMLSYVNVLSWDKIDMPASPNEPVPLYGGIKMNPPRSETRKVLVFAVIANPNVLKIRGKNAENGQEQSNFIEVLLDFIETMNKDVVFDRKYTILKDRDITGELKEVWVSVQNQRERDNQVLNQQETWVDNQPQICDQQQQQIDQQRQQMNHQPLQQQQQQPIPQTHQYMQQQQYPQPQQQYQMPPQNPPPHILQANSYVNPQPPPPQYHQTNIVCNPEMIRNNVRYKRDKPFPRNEQQSLEGHVIEFSKKFASWRPTQRDKPTIENNPQPLIDCNNIKVSSHYDTYNYPQQSQYTSHNVPQYEQNLSQVCHMDPMSYRQQLEPMGPKQMRREQNLDQVCWESEMMSQHQASDYELLGMYMEFHSDMYRNQQQQHQPHPSHQINQMNSNIMQPAISYEPPVYLDNIPTHNQNPRPFLYSDKTPCYTKVGSKIEDTKMNELLFVQDTIISNKQQSTPSMCKHLPLPNHCGTSAGGNSSQQNREAGFVNEKELNKVKYPVKVLQRNNSGSYKKSCFRQVDTVNSDPFVKNAKKFEKIIVDNEALTNTVQVTDLDEDDNSKVKPSSDNLKNDEVATANACKKPETLDYAAALTNSIKKDKETKTYNNLNEKPSSCSSEPQVQKPKSDDTSPRIKDLDNQKLIKLVFNKNKHGDCKSGPKESKSQNNGVKRNQDRHPTTNHFFGKTNDFLKNSVSTSEVDSGNSGKNMHHQKKSTESPRRTQTTVNSIIKSVFKINQGNHALSDEIGKKQKSNNQQKISNINSADCEDNHKGYTILKKSEVSVTTLNNTEEITNDMSKLSITDCKDTSEINAILS